MKILELKNVGYKYNDGNTHVLKDINMEFELGKVYAIKGRSGSGKTTLLSLISGLEKCIEGTISYDNKNLNKMDLDRYRNQHVGIVFQSFNLLPHLSALENVIMSIDVSGIKVKNKKEMAFKLLANVGIDEETAKRKILKLSGGEQQRVAIARSLSYNPKIILADEPTGNLDRETEEEIMAILIRLAKEENKCIIIVSHSDNVAKSVDKVYELKGKSKK